MNTISLKLPPHLLDRLERRASMLGTTKSEIVRESLEAFLEGNTTTRTCMDLGRDLIGTAPGPKDLST
jgi:metal-responsive CopG/Arc/MetJ family transcriptional regulator